MSKTAQIETIVCEIIKDGKVPSKRSAWQFARSESAKLEAQLIELFQDTQDDIVDSIKRLTPKKLLEYKTDKIVGAVEKLLSQMIATGKDIAFRMTYANILAGKIQSTASVSLHGDELLNRIKLNKADIDRVNRIANDVVENLKKGASLALSSVKAMLQKASIQANATRGNASLESREKIEQTPMSNSTATEDIINSRAKKSYKEIALTSEELERLKSNPKQFASELAKLNSKSVQTIRSSYFKKQNERKRQAGIEKAKASGNKENQSSGEKAILEMQETLDKNGVFAFSDAGGKRWTLGGYCSMIARTSSMRSTNLGEVFADDECDLYYIVPHAGSCPICSKYEGKVYSRSGKDPRYPPLASVFGKIDPNGTNDLDNTYLTIHPNCRHKIVKYTKKSPKFGKK